MKKETQDFIMATVRNTILLSVGLLAVLVADMILGKATSKIETFVAEKEETQDVELS